MLRSTRPECLLLAARSLAAVALALLAHHAPADAAGPRRPNVIVIVADDLGYGELGCYGGTDAPSPNIDAMAKAGATCTAGYVTCPVCSPTRAGLLTGRYQQRFGHENNIAQSFELEHAELLGLPLDEQTLAERLKAAGYRTAAVGKWHLGVHDRYHPLVHGFDEFFGFLDGGRAYLPDDDPGNFYFKSSAPYPQVPFKENGRSPVMRGRETVQEREYLTDAFTREALAFIESNKTQPFLLYLAYSAPHTPITPCARWEEKLSRIQNPIRRTIASMVAAMDEGIGKIRERLRTHGLADDTIVVFLSDNGGSPGGNKTLIEAGCDNYSLNTPLRGFKGECYEGGIRVPYLVEWPGHVAAGTTYDRPVSSLDIVPTALAAAGIPVPTDTDGASLLPFLAADRNDAAPHSALFWRFGGWKAVRQGDLKLLKAQGKPDELYDLATDVAESRNLAAERPEDVARLNKSLTEWERGMIAPRWTGTSPRARVGVFVDRDFAGVGKNDCLPGPICVRTLEAFLPVEQLTVSDLADPTKLNASRLPLLVLASADAFPETALDNLRRYRRSGGSLITFGTPFHLAASRKPDGKPDEWTTRHIKDLWAHNDAGLATSGLRGPLPRDAAIERMVPENPLGFTAAMLAGANPHQRRLEPKTFPAGDEVIPLVTIRSADDAELPIAAAIHHRCRFCPGACDVWLGQTVWNLDAGERYAGEQLLVRGALWSLKERQLLGAADVAERLARLDAVQKPAEPTAAPLKAAMKQRSWGDTFLPTSPPPARTIQTVSLYGLPVDERIAVTCLQGLLARTQPRLFLGRNPAEDKVWMDWCVAKGHVDAFEPVADWKSLVGAHRDSIKGVVIPDPSLYRGDVLAVNVAACEDLLVASPQLAEKLGLPVVVDLRGRFMSYAEGLAWLWATYKDRLNPHLCDFRFPGLLPHGTFDYAYQWRGLMFWVAGPREEHEPGVDRLAERDLMARILAEMPANGVCVGFPGMAEGEGMGEPPGVELLSRFGKSLVCTNHQGNYSLSSGMRIDRLASPPAPSPPALERDKIYIALNLSDGDNQILWPGYFRRHFEHPSFGSFPLAFGIGPAIRELQPAVAQWYFEHASPTTEFFADVSGAGYMQPDHFGEAFTNREQVWAGYLESTRRLMEPLGLRTIRTVGGSDANVQRFATALPFCHSIFADMGRYSGRSGIENLTYSLPDGMPVFRAVTSWRYGKEGFLREIREQVGDDRPAFVNGFAHCWTFDMDALAKIHAERDADMVFVTPSQLAALYREAKKLPARP
ncbi:MAG: sulfatase-like hydrolase/transferase [Planctomycetia bacterium]